MKNSIIILLVFILFLLLSTNLDISKISFIQIVYVIYFIILISIPLILSFNVVLKKSKFKNKSLLIILRTCFFILFYSVIIYFDSKFTHCIFGDGVDYLPEYLIVIAPVVFIINDLFLLFDYSSYKKP